MHKRRPDIHFLRKDVGANRRLVIGDDAVGHVERSVVKQAAAGIPGYILRDRAVDEAQKSRGESICVSLAFDWIGKSYWFFWVIHICVETSDYEWSNIEAFSQFLLVLIDSKPVIDGI